MNDSIPAGFDFTDPELFEKRRPQEEWRRLRRTEPVHWVDKTRWADPASDGYDDAGYWLVTRHRDVKEVSRLSGEVYSAGEKTSIARPPAQADPSMIELQRALLINQDGEQHRKHRRIISRGFTPRGVAGLREDLRERAERIVTEAAAGDPGDFVTTVACELPLQAIAELLGIPQQDRHKVFDWSNRLASYDVPGGFEDSTVASAEILGYAHELAEKRRADPQPDIITTLVQSDVDGESLTPEEFGWFVVLLAFAGNETTRNATTHGMIAMLDNPGQWERFKAERPDTAYDEVLRWATPVTQFQRTAVRDTELSGTRIAAGDRLVLCYGSANFDEDVFEDPFTFDIGRDPNPHLTFGGQGPHYCIGANLARMQIELIFTAIADHLPDLRALGEPTRFRSGWLNGITRWPVDFGRCPAGH